MAQAADFFVSYTGADRAWAEWIAWQLEAEGYRVIIQAWDFEPGDNFVVRMRDALEQADRTLALVSAAYLASPYCTDEWTGAFLHDPDGRNRLLQVHIEACELPRLLRAGLCRPGWHAPRAGQSAAPSRSQTRPAQAARRAALPSRPDRPGTGRNSPGRRPM